VLGHLNNATRRIQCFLRQTGQVNNLLHRLKTMTGGGQGGVKRWTYKRLAGGEAALPAGGAGAFSTCLSAKGIGGRHSALACLSLEHTPSSSGTARRLSKTCTLLHSTCGTLTSWNWTKHGPAYLGMGKGGEDAGLPVPRREH